jgi:very-short-patch-repair endonuclease
MDEYEPRLKGFARNLRAHQTEAEARLWLQLRRDQLGVRFLRQRPLGQYIVDFYAPKARLVIELDGSQHMDDPKQRDKDQRRDAWLRSRGLKVLRFDDRQVLTETRAVMEVIFKVVEEAVRRGIPPSLPISKGGEPRRVTEGSLPFVKGGQEGFDDASQTDPLQD